MATGSPILGKLKGSIGDITTQSNGSKQVTRRRVREVANPQTDAQTLNRIVTGTVGAAYSRLKDICDHSFQGFLSKNDNMQKFLRVNQNAFRAELVAQGASLSAGNFLAIGKTGLIANRYIISQGTLPSITTDFDNQQNAERPLLPFPNSAQNPITYQAICDYFNLRRGDQLTFCWIENAEYPSVAEEEALWGLNSFFFYSRIILDPIDPITKERAPMSTQFLDGDGQVNFPSSRNSGVKILITPASNRALTFFPDQNAEWGVRVCLAFGIIVSRQVSSTWLRSFCRLAIPLSCQGIPTMAQAIEYSYPDVAELLDPSKFLNASPKN